MPKHETISDLNEKYEGLPEHLYAKNWCACEDGSLITKASITDYIRCDRCGRIARTCPQDL